MASNEDELEAATRFNGSEGEDDEDSSAAAAGKTENVWLTNGNKVLPDLAAL